MRIKRVLDGIDIVKMTNFKNYNISSITHISSEVIKGGMFVCIEGLKYDGNAYVEEAIQNGAKCIVTEKKFSIENVTVIQVKNVRIAMSMIAKNFYNRCVDDMDVIGIIGTSGKTTTSLLIAKILSKYGNNIGVIGTNGIYIGNIKMENNFTTPDPLELHYVFYQMKMLGVKTVVMEVSAQAIHLHKMYGIKLRIGVFTNISEEHLDFFGSMEEYVRCKMNYFNKCNMSECVINTDDFYGRELALKLDLPCVSYGINNPANAFAVDIESDMNGIKFIANIFDDIISIKSKMVGNYNVYNFLASMSVCRLLGYSKNQIQNAIDDTLLIDGRFNVWEYNGNKIIVDFAHTPDSIDKLLSFIRKNVNGRVISLFGCVGYSTKDKRIKIAEVVDKYSDYIIISTDNRGTTSYSDICNDIESGIKKCKFISIEDRKSAIDFGIGMLDENDVLVIIGKGAENFQKIGEEKIGYSDIECVKAIVNKKE